MATSGRLQLHKPERDVRWNRPPLDTSHPLYCPPDQVPAEGQTIFCEFIHSRSLPDYKIDPETGCWVWQKFLLRGYAVSGTKKMHRLYWERANGCPVPPDHDIHHLCKNRACINPDHLEALHQREHDVRHFLNERAGITLEQAREIRERMRDPAVKYLDIQSEYGIGESLVNYLLYGKRWADILGGPVVVDHRCVVCDIPITGKRNKRFCSHECKMANRKAALS